MNRLLFCEPWPVSDFQISLDQFLDGIISLFVTHQFMTRHDHFLAGAFLAGAFFFAVFGAASSSSAGAAATFSFFGRGPIEGLALSVRISVMRSTVISSR